MNKKTFKIVSDIPKTYTRITDTERIATISTGIGLDDVHYYHCMFYHLAPDGDYESIYGCIKNDPLYNDPVYKLW